MGRPAQAGRPFVRYNQVCGRDGGPPAACRRRARAPAPRRHGPPERRGDRQRAILGLRRPRGDACAGAEPPPAGAPPAASARPRARPPVGLARARAAAGWGRAVQGALADSCGGLRAARSGVRRGGVVDRGRHRPLGPPPLHDPARPRAAPPRCGAPRDRRHRGASPGRDLGGEREAVALLAAVRNELRRARSPRDVLRRPAAAARAGVLVAARRPRALARADDGAVAHGAEVLAPLLACVPPSRPGAAAPDDARAATGRDEGRAACSGGCFGPRAILTPMHEIGTMRVKSGLAEMLKGGVIMDVVDAEQAKVAEEAGACAVMALERVPADIRRDGGVARMSDPDMIRGIQEAVTIPVMAKCRIGHFVEAQVLQSLEIDYIDESEVLTPADLEHHVDKWKFTVPFVCGATNLGEALRRIGEGAAMIRTKGEAGTGDIVNAVTHMRSVFGAIRRLQSLREEELYAEAKNLQAPYDLVRWVSEHGRLPVVTFTAGGIATPADASLCMQLGADGVFVGSGIFKSGNPSQRARAIVEATTHYMDADVLARGSSGLGGAVGGVSTQSLDPSELLERRGW